MLPIADSKVLITDNPISSLKAQLMRVRSKRSNKLPSSLKLFQLTDWLSLPCPELRDEFVIMLIHRLRADSSHQLIPSLKRFQDCCFTEDGS